MPDSDLNLNWLHAVIERHEAALLRYAARLTGDPDQARDIVQDAFIRLCRESPEARADHVAEWLYTVCRNRAFDLRRKDRRMTPLAPAISENRISTAPDPAAAAQTSEDTSRVLALLDHLPENQQEVLRLKFQGGLSYREIAGVTKLSVTNVGFLIHTALKSLREKLHIPAAPLASERSRS